ncbi:hypothetical protein IWW38_001872 [Coemansia aciculifera]|uniref:Uncharacterized protein n=1 Tax=Coemansia aciculifera TaxID=417176 RepID=A0ACC1M5J3_9FUNG|nr:hypothetical protein IWW38_001872 [Coemansia aciculifera]
MSAQSTGNSSPVIDANPDKPPVYVYDWSSSEDVANWSLTSLSTNSVDTSFSSWSSLLTPSPEYVPNDESSDNVETLTGSFILDLTPRDAMNVTADHSSARRATPERRIAAARRSAQQQQQQSGLDASSSSTSAATKRHLELDDETTRKRRKHKISSSAKLSPARGIAGIRARRRKAHYSLASLPGTPEKLSETLRPSGSPTRVSGTKVVADVNFTDVDSRGLCKVDKSLVCKGFWEAIEKVGRVCLPRRSGKTYNLTQMLLFFSMSPELDYLEAMPESACAFGGAEEKAAKMDVEALCRKRRECLFRDSLLQTMYPDFFAKHFMKYPVLYISLSECKGASFGIFLKALGNTLASVAQKWIEEIDMADISISARARYPSDQLKRKLQAYEDASDLPASQMAEHAELTQSLFQALSTFIVKQFGQYLLLIDEYDIPFISIHLAKWSVDDKLAALDIMKALFQKMLKDNKYLLKGLLFGVFEIPLTEMGSGANNIKDIRMIPAEESDIQGSILTAAHPHSGCGMDALTDSFWFNAHEVEQMLDNSTKWCVRIAKHKAFILQTIKMWYNGYYIGRFRGKYNPWSVSSFIEALCGLLSQTTSDEEADIAAITKSAARAYWVTTGTTGLIEAQIDRHRTQFIQLAKRLLRDYEATKSKSDGASPDKTAQSQLSPPPVPLVATRLNLINFDSEVFSEPGLLTLCLYAGYLTRRLSTSVCIPNHEVYQVWLQLFARAVLGTELADNSTNNARGALLSELWENKTDLLCTLATSSHGVLSNHNNYLENDYANHVANTIMAVSRFGMLTHPKQRTVEVSHVVPSRENHAGIGKCDYAMRLFSSRNRPNQFGVVIEFKLIDNSRREDTAYHRERAEEGLRQIGIKNYDACLVGCLERMDVGMAIGNNAVYAVSRLYKRHSVDAPWRPVSALVKQKVN